MNTDLDWSCRRCNKDTQEEFFMIHNHLWRKMPDMFRVRDSLLCILCIEHFLGRTLTPEDFTDCLLNVLNKESSCTDILKERILGKNYV